MENKVLVGKLVEHYWNLQDTKDTMEILGNVTDEEIAMLNNLLLDADRMLTNISKRWAKGLRDRDYHYPNPPRPLN